MKQALILILSIIGLLAIYWVLIGQWKLNKKLREDEVKFRKLADNSKENGKK